MKPEARDPVILQTILLLIGRIRNHVARTTAASFAESDDDIDLLFYRLAMIGEYVQNCRKHCVSDILICHGEP